MSVGLGKVRVSSGGTTAIAWAVYDSGSSGACTFYAEVQRPGDTTFGSSFELVDDSGTPLHADGSGWQFDWCSDVGNQWILVFVVSGETAFSRWASGDNLQTWKRQT